MEQKNNFMRTAVTEIHRVAEVFRYTLIKWKLFSREGIAWDDNMR
jgi:hypothetical protein